MVASSMSASAEWLKSLITLQDFEGNPVAYIDHLFEIFTRDFIVSTPMFRGSKVFHDQKDEGGKPQAFVHITTEENRETGERELCLRRCERMAWIRPIIEHADNEDVLVWNKEQQTSKGWKMRTYLYLHEEDFLVILEEKTKGHFMITAIYVDDPVQKKKHLKAYGQYISQKGSL